MNNRNLDNMNFSPIPMNIFRKFNIEKLGTKMLGLEDDEFRSSLR